MTPLVTQASVTAQDLFEDTSGTHLADHVPDAGFGGWNELPANGGFIINTNEKSLITDASALAFAWCDSDLVDDFFTTWSDIGRGAVGATNQRAGLYFLAPATGAIGGDGREGVIVEFIDAVGGGSDIVARRYDSNGNEAQAEVITANFDLDPGEGARLGVDVSGLDVVVWTEPDQGGLRTIQGTFVLTADLRDGSHKRTGIVGNANGSSRMRFSDLDFQAPAAYTLNAFPGTYTLAGVSSKFTWEDVDWVALSASNAYWLGLTAVTDQNDVDFFATVNQVPTWRVSSETARAVEIRTSVISSP